jgi:hypothetical protein
LAKERSYIKNCCFNKLRKNAIQGNACNRTNEQNIFKNIYQRTFETKKPVLSYFWHYAKQYKTDIAEPLKKLKKVIGTYQKLTNTLSKITYVFFDESC